jgi:hypothetical protein
LRRSSSARGARAALVLVVGATGACGGGGGVDQTLDKVASYASTARLAAESRASGATTARYTRNVLHATHAELQENVRALRVALDSSDDSSRLAPPQRVRARAAAGEVEQTVGAMARLADADSPNLSALLEAGAHADEAGAEAKALADSAKSRE